MDNLKTSIRKGRDSWQAESSLPLGFTSDGKPAELHISTYKSGRGLATYAGVKLIDGHFTTTRVFRDYHQRLELSAQRCTEGNIERQHRFWLARIDTIKADAIAFHTAKGDIAATDQEAAQAEPESTSRPFDLATRLTPWGIADYVLERAPGIIEIGTPSHGGFWLSPERLASIPEGGRRFAAKWSHGWGDAWFEEDCASLQVFAAFPDLFPEVPDVDRENVAKQAANYATEALQAA